MAIHNCKHTLQPMNYYNKRHYIITVKGNALVAVIQCQWQSYLKVTSVVQKTVLRLMWLMFLGSQCKM